ncbi:MAG: glycosyltransferase family 1 protein, partial [Planctomycetota bacterium]
RAPAGTRLTAWPVPSRLMDLLGTTGALSADRAVGGCDLFHHTDYVLPEVSPRTPQVMTLHDLAFLRNGWHTARDAYSLSRIVARARRRCAGFLVPSARTARDCVERLGLAEDRVFVTPLGVEQRFFAAARSEPDAGARPYLLALGTVEPRKNHVRLMRAFESVAAKVPDVELHIAGPWGWRFEEVRAAHARSKVRDRIRFLGHVPDDRLATTIAGAAGVCYVSLFEGFGLPVLEAMAAGVPVVTSDIDPMREVAGNSAVLVDPYDVDAIADGLSSLLLDEALRRRLRQLGPARARTFDWATCATATLAAYEALAA